MSEPVSTMPIWSGFLTPILEVLADGEVWRTRELVTAVCDHIGLTDTQRAEVLPSGQRRAPNRIGWALSALVRAELVTKPARAMFRISQEGRAALVTHPEGLGERELKKIPGVCDLYLGSRGSDRRPGCRTQRRIRPVRADRDRRREGPC